MPQRAIPIINGEYYHIYNRGANREKIFFSPANYQYCERLVKKYSTQCRTAIIAYCLMPNHYHFLLRQDSEISLSTFINSLFNAYVQAVNKQQGRKGTLFEGRFRDIHIDQSSYLLQLCRYIHRNPLAADLVARLEAWPYSNYPEWIGVRGGSLVDRAFIQEQGFKPETYQDFVNSPCSEEQIKGYSWD